MRKKTGGRRAGTPNKTTKELKQLLTAFLSNELLNIQVYFNQLDDKSKLDMLVKLLSYVLPKPEPEPIEQQPAEDFGLLNDAEITLYHNFIDELTALRQQQLSNDFATN